MASHSRPRRREDFQVAVVCALPLEYDAAVFACEEVWDKGETQLGNASGDYNTYATGRMGGHDIVLLLLPNVGKVSAASAAASLRSSYHGIRLAILTGICGGVPGVGTTNEVFLGDVVISKSVVQYDLGRKYPHHFEPKDTTEDSLGRPNKEVRSLVATFQTLHGCKALQRRASQILEQVQRRSTDEGHQTLYRRPAATEDRLFESDYLHRHRNSSQCGCNESNVCESAQAASCDVLGCDRSHLVSRSSLKMQASPEQAEVGTAGREIRVLVGRVGSADTVLKAGLERDRIASEHDLIAFEMEGAGVWDEIPCIVIKATSSADLKLCIRSNSCSGTSRTSTRMQDRGRESRFMVLEVLGNATASSEPLHCLTSGRKTQIALAYIFWMQHAHPDVSVFWVHASNADRFRQAYSTIAQKCGIPGYDDPKADMLILVKTWLENGVRGRWLMVIDNADDTQLFFPSLSDGSITNTHMSGNTQGGLGRYIPECGHGERLRDTTRTHRYMDRVV
ncbi:kinesin light chain [Colletotrichum plurivorum]|uniref:Kinesin light chain n=1 Tax=Colletotrichum plurivorum TaxID=2175906 RepID=A0A8H6MUB1_9PEZI|nr:kinesin light chain [Colletotrichum plurivorum]